MYEVEICYWVVLFIKQYGNTVYVGITSKVTYVDGNYPRHVTTKKTVQILKVAKSTMTRDVMVLYSI